MAGWDLALQITASVVTIILTAGATAWFSIRANVRQHVWQKVFESKWETIQTFSKTLNEFSERIMMLENAVSTWKESVPTAFVRAHGLIEHTWPNASLHPQASFLLENFPSPEKVGHSTEDDRRLLESILIGYRNVIFQDIHRLYEKIAEGYSRLSLIGFDPQVAKNMELLAMEWTNRVSRNQMPYKNVDLAEFFPQWKAEGRLCKLRLRQDLVESAKSLGKALKLHPDWAKAVKERYEKVGRLQLQDE